MMQSRQADLAAGTFIMRLTACPKKAASLVKLGTSEKDSRADENELAASMGVDLCQNGTDGGIVSSFQNPLLAAAAKNMSAEGFAILQEKLLNAGVSALPTAALQHSSTTSLSGSASDGMSYAEFVRSLKAALKGEDTADHEVEDQDEDEEDKQVPGKGKKGRGHRRPRGGRSGRGRRGQTGTWEGQEGEGREGRSAHHDHDAANRATSDSSELEAGQPREAGE